MSAHIEVRLYGDDDGVRTYTKPGGEVVTWTLPPAMRRHYIREVAANNRVIWPSEAYATRANARRAARRYDLPVWEFDAAGVRVK